MQNVAPFACQFDVSPSKTCMHTHFAQLVFLLIYVCVCLSGCVCVVVRASEFLLLPLHIRQYRCPFRNAFFSGFCSACSSLQIQSSVLGWENQGPLRFFPMGFFSREKKQGKIIHARNALLRIYFVLVMSTCYCVRMCDECVSVCAVCAGTHCLARLPPRPAGQQPSADGSRPRLAAGSLQ